MNVRSAAKRLSNNVSFMGAVFPCSTMQKLQKWNVILSIRRGIRHFNSLQVQCFRTTSKPVVLKTIRVGSDNPKKLFSGIRNVNIRLNTPQTLFQYVKEHFRGFSLSTCSAAPMSGKRVAGAGQEKVADFQAVSVEDGWTLRLANENGFLSWCRNSYLTTVVAIAMMGEGTTALAEQAAEGAFVVAGLNLSWGTYQYVYNLFHLRRRSGMTVVRLLVYVSMAVLHLALWLVVCTLYLGYTDPSITAEQEKAEQEKAQTQNDAGSV